MARIITKGFDDIRPSPRKCDIRKAKRDASAFVYGMRRVLSHFSWKYKNLFSLYSCTKEADAVLISLRGST